MRWPPRLPLSSRLPAPAASYLSLHLLATVVAPAAIAGLCDYSARWAFLSQLRRDRKARDQLKRQAGAAPTAAATAGS